MTTARDVEGMTVITDNTTTYKKREVADPNPVQLTRLSAGKSCLCMHQETGKLLFIFMNGR